MKAQQSLLILSAHSFIVFDVKGGKEQRAQMPSAATPAQHHSSPAIAAQHCSETWGLCPDWRTRLLLSLLQVQLSARLSTCSRDTQRQDVDVTGHKGCLHQHLHTGLM